MKNWPGRRKRAAEAEQADEERRNFRLWSGKTTGII